MAHNFLGRGRGVPSPWTKRFNRELPKRLQLIPFGARVGYKPVPVTGKRTDGWGVQTLEGIFMGWAMNPGGRWTGDFLIVPLDQFEGCK